MTSNISWENFFTDKPMITDRPTVKHDVTEEDVTMYDVTPFKLAVDSPIEKKFQFGIHVIMYMVIGSIGVIDNGLVIIVITKSIKMMKKSYNILILNQSIIDMFASIFLISNSPPMKELQAPYSGIAAQVFCKLWSNGFWLWMFLQLSAANLWLITVERYVEIVHPLIHKRLVSKKRVVQIVASFYIIFFVFQLLVGAIPSYADEDRYCHHYNWPSIAAQGFIGFLCYLLAFIIPVITMIYCYSRMIISLQTRVNLQPQSQAEERRAKKMAMIRKNLLKTLMTVCIIFSFCLIFNQTFFMLVNFNLPMPFGTPFYHFTVYAQFLNSIINPFIYVFFYKEFQTSLSNLFQCSSNLQDLQDTTGEVNTTQTVQ